MAGALPPLCYLLSSVHEDWNRVNGSGTSFIVPRTSPSAGAAVRGIVPRWFDHLTPSAFFVAPHRGSAQRQVSHLLRRQMALAPADWRQGPSTTRIEVGVSAQTQPRLR